MFVTSRWCSRPWAGNWIGKVGLIVDLMVILTSRPSQPHWWANSNIKHQSSLFFFWLLLQPTTHPSNHRENYQMFMANWRKEEGSEWRNMYQQCLKTQTGKTAVDFNNVFFFIVVCRSCWRKHTHVMYVQDYRECVSSPLYKHYNILVCTR